MSRDYADAVRSWLRAARERESAPDTIEAMAEELESHLEELQVAQEELRVQSDELRETFEEADRHRRRYEELFHNAPVPYLTTDLNGLIRDINRAACELLRAPAALAGGKPLPAFFSPSGGFRARLGRLARLEHVPDWETEVVPAGKGQPVPVRVSAAAIPAGHGKEPEIRWVLRDLSAERVARERERELHRARAGRAAIERVADRARQLSDLSRVLMGVLEPDRVWNAAAAVVGGDYQGVMLLELEGPDRLRVRAVGGLDGQPRHHLESFVDAVFDLDAPPPSPPVVPVDRLALAIRHGEPEVMTASAATGNGMVSASAGCIIVPVKAHLMTRGAMIIWLAPGTNVGEELLLARHLAERIALALEAARLFQEVVRSRRDAEEARAAEADFLSVISHELRTPLTAIISYAGLLQERAGELPGNLGRFTREMANAAEHQRRLVDKILHHKRLERGEERPQPEPLDYRETARFALSLVRPQADSGAEPAVGLVLDLPDKPVEGYCDKGMLRQVLANLLANAIRHTEEGHVRLALTAQDPWVVITVEDTGEGIPPEVLPRIFDRFWSGTGISKHRGGSGLGLTISRELVQALGGDIEVSSEPGRGTTFTVRLPRVADRHGAPGESEAQDRPALASPD